MIAIKHWRVKFTYSGFFAVNGCLLGVCMTLMRMVWKGRRQSGVSSLWVCHHDRYFLTCIHTLIMHLYPLLFICQLLILMSYQSLILAGGLSISVHSLSPDLHTQLCSCSWKWSLTPRYIYLPRSLSSSPDRTVVQLIAFQPSCFYLPVFLDLIPAWLILFVLTASL